MSDLAKKCADAMRDEQYAEYCPVCGEFPNGQPKARNTANALAAFIEAAARVRETLGYKFPGTKSADVYDAALRDLAQSMEVE